MRRRRSDECSCATLSTESGEASVRGFAYAGKLNAEPFETQAGLNLDYALDRAGVLGSVISSSSAWSADLDFDE